MKQRPLAAASAVGGQGLRRRRQASAVNARDVISSTVPVPLMARYFGAAASPVAAQAE
jgi:hypothetical protein